MRPLAPPLKLGGSRDVLAGDEQKASGDGGSGLMDVETMGSWADSGRQKGNRVATTSSVKVAASSEESNAGVESPESGLHAANNKKKPSANEKPMKKKLQGKEKAVDERPKGTSSSSSHKTAGAADQAAASKDEGEATQNATNVDSNEKKEAAQGFGNLSFAEQMERVMAGGLQPMKRVKPPKVKRKLEGDNKKGHAEEPQKNAAVKELEEAAAKKGREQRVLAAQDDAKQQLHIVPAGKNASFFADQGFDVVPGLDERLIKQLNFLNFSKMTAIQAEAVPHCLSAPDNDVLLKAPTGSGKTLAFLIPLLSRVLKCVGVNKKATAGPSAPSGGALLTREEGVMAVVLSPTKELALQSLAVCEKLTRMLPWLVCGALAGGENPKSEKARIRKGIHLLFATPGRLNYHLEFTSAWNASPRFQSFVLDEADRLLDMGFEKQIKSIYRALESSQRRTMLVSATLTPGVQRLAEWCLDKEKRLILGFGGNKSGPVNGESVSARMEALADEAGTTEVISWSLPANLVQRAVITPTKTRLPCLVSLLKKYAGKVIVFFSSCASVDFHYDLFVSLRWPESQRKNDAQETKTYKGGFVGLKRDADDDSEEDNSDIDVNDSGADDGAKTNGGKKRIKHKRKMRRIAAQGPKVGVSGFIGRAEEVAADAKTAQPSSKEDADGGKAEDTSHAAEKKSGWKTGAKASIAGPANKQPFVFEDVGLFKLHGNLTADERAGFLRDFAAKDRGILLASDVVARGIDLPKIEVIIQYDPPQHLEEYLHRIGRTARCGQSGNSILFLQPNESVYLDMLQKKIDPNFDPENKNATSSTFFEKWSPASKNGNSAGSSSCSVVQQLSCERVKWELRQFAPAHFQGIRDLAEYLQSQMIEQHVAKSKQLAHLARRAFLSWTKAYSTFPRSLKPIFNVKALHPGHVASSFGLSETPKEISSVYKRDSSHHETGATASNYNRHGNKAANKGWQRGADMKASKQGQERHNDGAAANRDWGKPSLAQRLATEKKARSGDKLREERSRQLFVKKEKPKREARRGPAGGGLDTFC
ncbi:unnamed protein product [Amoebophrya sp. A25]|nr:unnamed protein product [Amoebophrya sp. A25]|eukprot:GSA25T00001881001.1